MLNICSVEHLEVKQSECLIYEIFVWSLFKIRSNAQRSLILAFVHQEQKSTVIGTDNYCFIIFKRCNLIENCFFPHCAHPSLLHKTNRRLSVGNNININEILRHFLISSKGYRKSMLYCNLAVGHQPLTRPYNNEKPP